jgi:hypothetical protein
MAIFNSIALGKSKGAIGNVTTTRIKGQQIAKSKVAKTGSILPANQTAAQKRMKNAVMAFQFLSVFLMFATPMRKTKESVYNAFVRFVAPVISNIVAESAALASSLLGILSIYVSNYCTVISSGFGATNTIIEFTAMGNPFEGTPIGRVLQYNSATGERLISEHTITAGEWAAGSFEAGVNLANADSIACYIYSTSLKKQSNIEFESPI